jgi:hypothetical protein
MTEAVPSTPEKKRARVRHLTAPQKAEAIALWKAGAITLDGLAEKFKKDRGTFVRLFKEAGVEKGSTEATTRKKAEEAVEASLIDEAVLLAKRIKEAREEHFRYVDGVEKLAWNVMVVARQEKRPPATFAADMKALELALRVFKGGRAEKYTILGINADDANEDKPLPELVVQELSSQDIQRLHEQSLMADDELGLNETLGDEDLISDAPDEDGNERVEED